ncbi:hypothetical protein IV203_023769 [Nitzschia inconspicua]|uniref:Uncharacterized protein n=1 Tax=Nitzschia inconspicua TaxID=303405 RepID=A0A9K3PB13_9STRA|nr:hypothetical protein IV203_023769 [Nitzschia inconspicua]
MDDHQHQPYRDEGNERHNGDSTRESPPIGTMSPSLSRAVAELRHSNDNRNSLATTVPSSTPISLEDCNVYTSRILQKIQITRRGLHHITQLCDRLSDNAIRWSSSEVLKQVFPTTTKRYSSSNNNHCNSLVQQQERLLLQLLSLPILEIAMKCVELAVASNTAMVCFFETFLKDLDVIVTTQSGWDWNMKVDDETTTKERNTGVVGGRSLFFLPTLSQLVQMDRMAMMAVRYTRTLQAIAQSNQRVLDEMEHVVNRCICDGGGVPKRLAVVPPKNGDSKKTSGDRIDTIRSAQADLTVLHQRIAVGLVLVAQMVFQWNAI